MKEAIVSIFILLVMMIVQAVEAASVLQGRVVGVADGDTITVLDETKSQHRIRLGGIDAPEKKAPFGDKSKQSLSDMVYRQQVDVLWEKKDRYGRIIGKVMMPWGDVNRAQLKAGMAWHYKHYARDQSATDRLLYAEDEAQAKRLRKGLWSDGNPIPPWDWRRRN